MTSCVGVLNILAFLKSIAEEKGLQSTNTVEYCISLLEKSIPDLEEEVSRKVGFLKEQLKLSITNKFGRRYTPDLLSMAVIWKNVSNALYKQIYEEGILTIPAPKYLDSLTSAFKVEGGTVEGDVPQTTKQYLKTRLSSNSVATGQKSYSSTSEGISTTMSIFSAKMQPSSTESSTLVPMASANVSICPRSS